MTKVVSPFPFSTHCTFIWIALQGFAFGSPSTNEKNGDMKRIASGSFELGCESECPMDDAKPRHKVTVSEFWMDITPVTNQEFAKFVKAPNYRTVAERIPTAAELPGVEIKDPKGPADSVDPSEPGVAKSLQRGGSYLCSDQYCVRYLVGSRGRGEPKSSASNLGFRCARKSNQ
jgi:formylglycine-generating enzyme required for sulfatase activity